MNGQKLIKSAKNGPFWRLFENLKLAVKQCYQTGQFQLDKNWCEMPKLENSNAKIWVISRHCSFGWDILVDFRTVWSSSFCCLPKRNVVNFFPFQYFRHPFLICVGYVKMMEFLSSASIMEASSCFSLLLRLSLSYPEIPIDVSLDGAVIFTEKKYEKLPWLFTFYVDYWKTMTHKES